MATITKKDLIERIAETEGWKRGWVKKVVQMFLDSIVEELGNGNRLEFRDFGVFEARVRASREAQNPRTMRKVRVPPRKTVKFKIGRILKQRLRAEPPEVDAATGLTVPAGAVRRRKPAPGREAPPAAERPVPAARRTAR